MKSTDSKSQRSTLDEADISQQVQRVRRENQALITRLNEGEKRFRSLAKAVWMVQEEERRSLARELHDGIGQTLTALKNQLERLRIKEADGPVAAGLGGAVEMVSLALDDTRKLSRLLRPAVLDDLGLEAALRWLSRTLREQAAIQINVLYNLDDVRLKSDIETLVFRVVQEALTNVIKHACASSVDVSVSSVSQMLRVSIRDQGIGFDPVVALRASDEGESLGLRSVRDRLELFGGRFSLTSSPGEGCTLEIALPLRDNTRSSTGENA